MLLQYDVFIVAMLDSTNDGKHQEVWPIYSEAFLVNITNGMMASVGTDWYVIIRIHAYSVDARGSGLWTENTSD